MVGPGVVCGLLVWFPSWLAADGCRSVQSVCDSGGCACSGVGVFLALVFQKGVLGRVL